MTNDQELARQAAAAYHARASRPPQGEGNVIAAWVSVVQLIRSAVLADLVELNEPQQVFVRGNDQIDRLTDHLGLLVDDGTGWCAPSP